MSRVFVARDTALDRDVVVKVLSAEHTTGVSSERFRREITLIARLQHPHIVPLLSAGAIDGALYYVMPFLGGETLRARIARDGPLPVAVVTRVLKEVLDALAFAHSHGVIHRDIKPDNILLEAGHAVVADFGVSKALRESGTLTSIGVALGTPMYMAPEQAAADPDADHLVDLYAVGVVAYEMLTGGAPFTGTPQQVIRAHMTQTPTPVLQRRPDVPPALADLIMRALEKEPRARPQSAAELLGVLENLTTPQSGTAAPTAPEMRVTPRRPSLLVAIAATLVLAGILVAWHLSRPPVIGSAQSLAIAPFSVATGDAALVRLGQNLVTTISANLDGVGEIRVADPIAVLSHTRGKDALLSARDAMQVARALGVRSVVHGTLVPSGSGVRADAVLYDIRNGAQLARVSVTAPIPDLAALTDSLTWQLLRAVWSRGRAPTPTVASITTRSPAALREFVDGERLFARGYPAEAGEAYKRAIAADTAFWLAYYRYSIALGWFALPADTAIIHRLRRHVAELPARERSLAAAIDSQYTQTERLAAYRRIAEQYPDYAPAWVTYADYLVHYASRSGIDVRDAVAPWQHIVALMPGDEESANHLVFTCIVAGDHVCATRAIAHYDSLVRSDSAPSPIARAFHRLFLLLQAPSRPQLADSLLEVARADSAFPGPVAFTRMWVAPLAVEQEHFADAYDKIMAGAMATGIPLWRLRRDQLRYLALTEAAWRGDWSHSVEAIHMRSRVDENPGFGPLDAVRMRVLGELQGFVAPEPITATAALAHVSDSAVAPAIRADALWIAALNAMLRNDSSAYAAHLVSLRGDASAPARIALRSLQAIADGRAGHHSRAADSLLAIEHLNWNGLVAPALGAFAANRLLGAQWLADAGRYAEADSLLRFTRGFIIWQQAEVTQPIYAFSQLVRSRISEGLGNTEDAVLYARIFLSVFDRAPPSQHVLIDEARQRIARLTVRDVRKPREH